MKEERYEKQVRDIWPNKQWIVCAAVMDACGDIEIGVRHADCKYSLDSGSTHGFVDNFGRFFDRAKAFKIAHANGQIRCYPPQANLDWHNKNGTEPRLFSENLY